MVPSTGGLPRSTALPVLALPNTVPAAIREPTTTGGRVVPVKKAVVPLAAPRPVATEGRARLTPLDTGSQKAILLPPQRTVTEPCFSAAVTSQIATARAGAGGYTCGRSAAVAIGGAQGRAMATRPEPLAPVRPREAAIAVIATPEAPPRLGFPPLASALPAIGAAGRPGGLQGPERVLLATRYIEAVVALEVVGRRAFLATLQAKGPLVVATISRLQDEEARDAIGGIGLRLPTGPTVTIGVLRVPPFLIPKGRQVLAAQAVVHAAPVKSAQEVVTRAASFAEIGVQAEDQMDTPAGRPSSIPLPSKEELPIETGTVTLAFLLEGFRAVTPSPPFTTSSMAVPTGAKATG